MPELSRRRFLLLAGGAGAAAATEPGRKLVNRLVPYVNPPQMTVPGEWAEYATVCRECPAGCGMRVRHRDGRVTKAEGNPLHPLNAGALCPRGQSSLQGLYDPDRLTRPLRRSASSQLPVSWAEALGEIGRHLQSRGKGRVAVISNLQTGTLLSTMQQVLASYSSDRLLLYEPFSFAPLRRAHRSLFGTASIPRYRLDKTRFILSLGTDFLETWISPVEFARAFARMHGYDGRPIGRFVHAGPLLSMTAANADEYLQMPPGDERWLALALLHHIVAERLSPVSGGIEEILGRLGGSDAAARSGIPEEKLKALARAFVGGRGIAMAAPAGNDSMAAADAAFAAGLLNMASGSIGDGVDFASPHALSGTADPAAVSAFLDRLSAEDILIIHNTNIAFTLPTYAQKLRKAGMVVYLGTLPDETAELADWVLPVDYPLEAWGEYAPYPGMDLLQQPTMARLYDTRNPGDIFMQLAAPGAFPPGQSFERRLRERWDRIADGSIATVLQRGGRWREGGSGKPPTLAGYAHEWTFAPASSQEIQAFPSASILLHDGRTANRGWIQEIPHPVTMAVWGSWVDMHPSTAKGLGIAEGDLVEVIGPSGKVQGPARVTNQVAPSAVAVLVGQGHSAKGLSIAAGVGGNGFFIGAGPVTVRRIGRKEQLVRVTATSKQHHRRIVQTVPFGHVFRQEPGEGGEEVTLPLPEGYDRKRDLYPPHEHRRHRWAMVVDLHRCIGCGACAVACYAENNIAYVGKKRCAEGREMAWLHVVPYETEENPLKLNWIPMLCQHCDAAPCEPVCPVYAAVHNEEGLNAQVYNRCIGTRYCSNNCPYKVRRFNWYRREWQKPLDMQLNPEVTVRSQGVMEKCTFCVQRIREVEYRARVEKRPVRDGEVVPACAQTCPTGVYTFGDLMDPQSQVSKLTREDPRRYQVLHELNTKPAVTYLKVVEQDPLSEDSA